MIDEIRVENLALIREADVALAPGLTVLTGETGAGKTALLSACKLLMGERADKTLVRDGATALEVSGRLFGVKKPESVDGGQNEERADAIGHACPADDDGVVVRRRVSHDGRSRVTIDGKMASVAELSRIVAASIDLCGQHEHQQLMRPANHVRILDAWAAETVCAARDAYVGAFDEAAAAAAELDRMLDASATSAQIEEARFTLKRIDEVNPIDGEYEELAATLAKSEHAESLAMAANTAFEALSGDGGALDAIEAAASALESASAFDKGLGAYASSLREASYVLEDVSRDTRAYRDSVDFDPDELAKAQERMGALSGLLRAYGPRMEDVLAARAAAEDVVSMVDDAAEREAAARRAVDEAEARLAQAADALDAARTEAAPRFASAVTAQMARLEMGSAELSCSIERAPRDAWTKSGPSTVEFLFKPGATMQPRPFARIASGGEASRVMLAIKVVLGEADSVETLIFDEVDAGVGGATAVALADVLADLARSHQVVVVTHLAQVAVRGDAHYVVEKSDGGMPETHLREVAGDDRVTEIARMLSGDATDASLAHAREMLEAAAK